jgi:diacylglycerol kinase (ATP)
VEKTRGDLTKPINGISEGENQSGFGKKILLSFKFAFSGIAHLIKTQHNCWIHLTFTVLTILIAGLLHFQIWRWIVLVTMIGFVWAAEAFNTTVEILVDIASPGYHEKAKTAKDIAAGAVLITSITAFIVGLLLFIPPFLKILSCRF